MPKAPWERDRGIEHVVRQWLASGAVRECLVTDETLEPRAGRYAPLPPALDPRLAAALRARGITRLYAHQAQAFDAAHARRHTVVATPTASGKSLCYNLPIAHALATEPDARALYLFPTKALSRDQEASLRALLHQAGLPAGAVVYDGDTPGDARRAARARGGAILTNPDMLHAGILPHHASWAAMFQSLRYVVIDELHTYKGVFGSHLANVLRRLRRVARFHGSDPVFLCASATIGNPREHAARLVGDDVVLVSESGAPAGPRRVLIYNPPVVNAELGIRASYVKSAVRLAADLVRADVSTIVFGPSRNGVEIMLRYLRDALVKEGVPAESIQAYRGGYLPETRRRIEQGLRAGEVKCVVATNALELGIDIGELDAVVCAGYPGSVAATWQRFGRAGRRGEASLSVLVTSSAPIDQYLAREPHYLLGRPVEEARIDPDNVEVLIQHLKCAAFELPFEVGEVFGDLDAAATGDALSFLAQHGVVHRSGTRWHWITDQYPAQNVGLRNVSWDNFVVIDEADGRAIGEVDWRGAHTTLYEQAIYQLEGETYQVERLDYENHKAFVRRVAPDYFTDAMTYVRVNVLEEGERGTLGTLGGTLAALGEVSVVEKVVGFKKVKFFTHEILGYGDVHLPEMEMHTTAFWFTVPEEVVQELSGLADAIGRVAGRARVLEGLRGLAHALEAVTSLALMCDPRDLGYTLGDKSDGTAPPSKDGAPGFDPTVFVYDNVAGGVGLAARAFERRDEMLSRARELVETCPCAEGCPSCVSPGDGGAHARKAMALAIFRALGVPLPA
jgi:DEAD/DEAH box helicase domain-containing protein